MRLKTLVTAALTLLVASLLTLPQPADARRMGSGGNVGKQYSMPGPATAPQQAPGRGALTTAGQRPQTGGASRWLGPLAGLAAGGLLASLFMGGAFEGFQLLDVLLLAALAVGGFMLYRRLRRGQAGPQPVTVGAYGRTAPNDRPGVSPDTHGQGSHAVGLAPSAADLNQYPAWFDGASFIAGAKDHYIRLQASWDKADFNDIRDYTTPELFAELQRDRERLAGPQYTEVVRLNAELASVRRDGDLAVASILFSGLIREDQQGVAEELRELWHVQHPWASAAGDWYIAGIQQAS